MTALSLDVWFEFNHGAETRKKISSQLKPFSHSFPQVRTVRSMPQVGRPERRRERTFVEREATDLLQAARDQKKISFKVLARRLALYGVEISPSALANRVGRGQFSVPFLLVCLRAMGHKSFRINLPEASAKYIAELRKAESGKAERKPPTPPRKAALKRVSTSGTTSSARNPRR